MIKVNKGGVKLKGNKISISLDLINLLYSICSNDECTEVRSLVRQFTDIDFDKVKENIEKRLKGVENYDKTRTRTSN